MMLLSNYCITGGDVRKLIAAFLLVAAAATGSAAMTAATEHGETTAIRCIVC